jgi:asparagine synthase (glutamine-hydrolysing)
MPGLVGVVSLNDAKINPNLMPAMRDAIKHRDWYQLDDYANAKGTVAISRVHLGIVNRDKQPYAARNGRVKVFLHGEIYNDEAAHSNPLEFIYRLYEKQGLEFASFLNGSFVIVIVDEDEGAVFIANDRIAYKPLFCFSDGEALYFGPEMKSLLLVPSLERKINLAGVADFLTNGCFTREHTLIEGLETMDKATVLKLTASGIARHRYWEYDLGRIDKDRGSKHYQEILGGLLRQAVRRRLRTDNTYGILLSGGYDSRGILGSYLEERGAQDLRTISWGREEDIPNSDCAIAKRLAQKLGTQHRFYKLTAEEVIDNFREVILLGEGLTDFPESYDVFHRIREQQGVDVVLRGDHCFGSAKWLKVHDEHTMFLSIGLKALQSMDIYQRVLNSSYYQSFCELDAEAIRQVSSRCSAKNVHDRRSFFYVDTRTRYYFGPLNYVKNFALESFTPLLDYDILDFVSTLPVRYRLGKSLWRETVVETFPELFEEIAKTHNMINWAASLRGSPEFERFVYRELIEDQNVFSEFINTRRLKGELDAFFSTRSGSQTFDTSVRKNTLEVLKTLPTAYRFAYKCSYYARKWLGRTRDVLSPERLILRLLILKVWGDVFLNYPVVRMSE